MKKIITFCLYGNNPIYQVGAVKNLKLAKIIYPDWVCRFYLFKEDHHIETDLLNISTNIEVVKVPVNGGPFSTLYRFLPLGEEDIERFISRDSDSRLSIREKEAVNDWIKSDKTYHIIKDHPYHFCDEYPVLAGMWGAKGNTFKNAQTCITEFVKLHKNDKGIDQKFLYYFFHKIIKDDYLEHSINTFPSPRNFDRDKIHFVGQPFDENDNFYGDWKNDLKVLNISLKSEN
jgi:hypothetical protein